MLNVRGCGFLKLSNLTTGFPAGRLAGVVVEADADADADVEAIFGLGSKTNI